MSETGDNVFFFHFFSLSQIYNLQCGSYFEHADTAEAGEGGVFIYMNDNVNDGLRHMLMTSFTD